MERQHILHSPAVHECPPSETRTWVRKLMRIVVAPAGGSAAVPGFPPRPANGDGRRLNGRDGSHSHSHARTGDVAGKTCALPCADSQLNTSLLGLELHRPHQAEVSAACIYSEASSLASRPGASLPLIANLAGCVSRQITAVQGLMTLSPAIDVPDTILLRIV